MSAAASVPLLNSIQTWTFAAQPFCDRRKYLSLRINKLLLVIWLEGFNSPNGAVLQQWQQLRRSLVYTQQLNVPPWKPVWMLDCICQTPGRLLWDECLPNRPIREVIGGENGRLYCARPFLCWPQTRPDGKSLLFWPCFFFFCENQILPCSGLFCGSAKMKVTVKFLSWRIIFFFFGLGWFFFCFFYSINLF